MAADLHLANEHLPKYLADLRRLVSEHPSFAKLKGLLEGGIDSTTNDHDKVLNQDVIMLGKEHFTDLFTVAKYRETQPLGALADLCGPGQRVVAAAEVFKSLADVDVHDPLYFEHWYHRLSAYPGRDDKPYQNFIDAMGCAYVVSANKELEGTTTRIMLLSQAPALRHATRGELLISDPIDKSGQYYAYRDLDYFLMWLIHKRSSESLKSGDALIEVLLDLYGEFFERNRPPRLSAVQVLDETAERWTAFVNVYLL